MEKCIECKDLHHTYGEKEVLHGLSFSVGQGEVLGLLGKNGAGKSTTINILMGFLRPSSGQCRVLGEKSHELSPEVKKNIALLHEGFIQYDYMSIKELEDFYSQFYPKWNRDVYYELINKLPVPHTRKITRMSCGQRSQVVLGLLLAQMPKVMILDDYSMGLDVGYRRLFIDYLNDYVKSFNTTVLLTSHVVQELDSIVDKIVVIKEGNIVADSSKKEFLNTFNGFSFIRSDSSETLAEDNFFSTIEHIGKTTSVYGFFKEDELKKKLTDKNIPHKEITKIQLNFEDAFIGLTGKY